MPKALTPRPFTKLKAHSRRNSNKIVSTSFLPRLFAATWQSICKVETLRNKRQVQERTLDELVTSAYSRELLAEFAP